MTNNEKDKGEMVEIPEEDDISPESTYKRKLFSGNKPPKVTGKKENKDGQG